MLTLLCLMLPTVEAQDKKEFETFTYHFVRRSRASRGAEYRERIRISTETTDEDGFFNVNVFT